MMKDTIFANRDALTKLDRSFWMELHFLEHALDSKLSIHLQNCLMAILPEKGQVQSMTKAVLACRQLATGRVAMAAGKSAERELQGCCNLLSDCCEGRSPTASAVTKMSPFSMLFLKKAENFCVYNTVEGSEDMTGRASRKVVLTGANALLSRFDKCSAPHKDPDSADLKVSRTFRWMLNEDQNARVDEWLRVAVLIAKDKMATAKKEPSLTLRMPLQCKKAVKCSKQIICQHHQFQRNKTKVKIEESSDETRAKRSNKHG